jgi:hypothetical protein
MGYRAPKNITPEEFGVVLDKFQNCEITEVKLEGISEPMMHPQFDECAKILKQKFPNAHVIIATNLQYKIEKTPFFRTLDYVDTVYLSIDGIGEIYEEARKPAKYSTLLESLVKIKKYCSAEQLKKLNINFVCTIENYKCLPDIYKLKEEYNLNSVGINLAQNLNEDEKGACEFNDKLIEALKKYKDDIRGVAKWDYSDCFWPYEALSIDVFGNVRQCIINTSQKPLMNIFEDDVESFFNESSHYLNTREMLSRCNPTENCKNCDYKLLTDPLQKISGENSGIRKPRAYQNINGQKCVK